ncbi:MAG: hypothetical protein EOM50_07425, partial [Erysipelotrichia bacterium]|nr:hypothetical protein [Erysipelotrichia bacterium]
MNVLMVNSMSALQKLWLYKVKGQVRNLFSKKSSAIFTVLIVLFYGAIFVSMFFMDKTMISAATMFDLHTTVLIPIGFTAMMVFTVLFQKRKALFFAQDAFYLFSGPFNKQQVNKYLISQTIVQSLLFGLLSIFIMVCLGSNLEVNFLFYLLVFFINAAITFFFLMLTDYLYVLSITNAKYKMLSRVIAYAIVIACVLLFLFAFVQNDFQINSALSEFVQSNLFYLLPLFGWGKLALIAYVESNFVMLGLGLLAMFVAIAIVYYCFIHFKGDYYEQALNDSIAYSEYYEQVKAGKSMDITNKKMKNVNVSFKEGASALFVKGMLTLRKTNGFINGREILVLILYLAISYFSDLGLTFFMYMLLFYMASILQESDLAQELKNYQIYLIPEKPLNKLIAIILPTLIKTLILDSVAIVVAGFIFSASLQEMLLNMVMIYGYTFVFVAASILSIRILKSRNNIIMENMLRMLVMIASALPSIILTVYIMINPELFTMDIMYIIS